MTHEHAEPGFYMHIALKNAKQMPICLHFGGIQSWHSWCDDSVRVQPFPPGPLIYVVVLQPPPCCRDSRVVNLHRLTCQASHAPSWTWRGFYRCTLQLGGPWWTWHGKVLYGFSRPIVGQVLVFACLWSGMSLANTNWYHFCCLDSWNRAFTASVLKDFRWCAQRLSREFPSAWPSSCLARKRTSNINVTGCSHELWSFTVGSWKVPLWKWTKGPSRSTTSINSDLQWAQIGCLNKPKQTSLGKDHAESVDKRRTGRIQHPTTTITILPAMAMSSITERIVPQTC